jgi:hypothetical protein
VQFCIVTLGLGTLALTFAQQHCDSIRYTGMTTAPFISEVVPATVYYLLHVTIRVATYTLLFAHRPALGFVVIILMIGTNFAVLSCDQILRWGCAKEFSLWKEDKLDRAQRVILAGMSLMAPIPSLNLNTVMRDLMNSPQHAASFYLHSALKSKD